MIAEQALTGYSSIDEPWLKYYDEGLCSVQIPESPIWNII